MNVSWNPQSFEDVVRLLSDAPGPALDAIAATARVVGPQYDVRGLPCPSPSWDKGHRYRVSGDGSVPTIEREYAPGQWMMAPHDPRRLGHFNVALLSDEKVVEMHDSIRRALEEDARLEGASAVRPNVRGSLDWKEARDKLEAELRRRSIEFVPLVW